MAIARACPATDETRHRPATRTAHMGRLRCHRIEYPERLASGLTLHAILDRAHDDQRPSVMNPWVPQSGQSTEARTVGFPASLRVST